MKALRVSVCLALWLAGMLATAQEDDAPSADFLDFLASWNAEDQEWLDEALENENRDQESMNEEEASDED